MALEEHCLVGWFRAMIGALDSDLQNPVKGFMSIFQCEKLPHHGHLSLGLVEMF